MAPRKWSRQWNVLFLYVFSAFMVQINISVTFTLMIVYFFWMDMHAGVQLS